MNKVPIIDSLLSTNTTVHGSPGQVTRHSPVYNSLPPDSRAPAAPIDPSSMWILKIKDTNLSHIYPFISLEVVLHLVCSGIDLLVM